MTAREKHITQKRKEIERIAKQQVKLITKAAKIATQPYKRIDTLMRRMGKVVVILMQVRALEIQKQMIIAQPIPKGSGFVSGGSAIVGESGPEVIIKPGGFQTCPIGKMNHIPINRKTEIK